MPVTTEKSAGATAIRPFHIEVPQGEIDELRRRVQATQPGAEAFAFTFG